MFLINSLSLLNVPYILLLATQVTYTLDGLVGLVYYHNFKTANPPTGDGALLH
jgi:hypothetical protein